MRVRGVDIALHPPPDHVSDHIRATGDFWEAEILDSIRRRLLGEPAGVLIDVGAMIGNHTAYFASFVPHTRIHAFEPAPVNLERLRQTVARFPSVEVHPIALSDVSVRLAMIVEGGNLGHALVLETEPEPPSGILLGWDVDAVPLDSFDLEEVRLIKIDAEGHEPRIIAGAIETVTKWRPLIVLEDWPGTYGELLPGYRLAESWQATHQTYLYEPSERSA